MAITYTDNGGGAPNGSDLEFTYTFPIIQTEDVKVALNGVTQATTKYSVDNVSNPTKITFNNTSVDSSVQETSGAPKSGVLVRVYRETTVGKANGDEDPKAVFAAGSSIRATDLNANQEQALFAIHELQSQPVLAEQIDTGAITSDKILDGTIATTDIADSAITTAKINADAINGTKIADDSINSEHYVDGSIDTQHIADNQITTAKIADDAITTAKIADGAVNTDRLAGSAVNSTILADNAVSNSKIQTNAVSSVKIENNAVIGDKIANGAVTNAKLATDAVTTTIITNSNVTTAKIADGAVTNAKIADGTIATEKYVTGSVSGNVLANGAVTEPKITDGSVTTPKIADAELRTLAGMQSGTASKLADSTTLTADIADLNQIDGMQKATTVTDDDTKFPTSGAIVDYVAAQLEPFGGFEAIANESSFPNTQPVSGVCVSIADAGGMAVSNTGTASGATVGGTTVNISGIPSNFRGTTVNSGVRFIVVSTGSGQNYTYHKATLKEDDLVNLSGDINDFSERYRVGSSNPTTSLDNGDLFFNTGSGKLLVYNGTNSAWEETQSVGNFFINTLSSSSATGGGSATPNGTAYRFTLSNAGANAQQHLVSVDGVVQKPNSGTSQPSEGFAINSNDIIFGSAPVNGASIFVITIGASVSIGTPSNNTVNSAILQNGSVTTAKIVDGSVTAAKLASGAADLLADTSPQLGGNLDGNDFEIALDADKSITFDGKGNIEYKSSQFQITNSTGDILIDNNSSGHDVKIYTDTDFEVYVDNGDDAIKAIKNGSVELYHDNTKKFETTSDGATLTGRFSPAANDSYGLGQSNLRWANLFLSGDIDLLDDDKVKLGNSDDLELYHSGGHSIIHNDTGYLRLSANGSGVTINNGDNSETMATFVKNGAVDLYHDNTKKLETADSGIKVTGNSIRVNDNSAITGTPHIYNYARGAGATSSLSLYGAESALEIVSTDDGTHGGSLLLRTTTDGAGFVYNPTDNALELKTFDTTADNFNLHNNGAHTNQDTQLRVVKDGAVELNHNGSKKLETTSTGIELDGNIQIPDGGEVKLGTGSDLRMFHANGNANFIQSYNDNSLRIHTFGTSAQVKLQTNESENNVVCKPNGETELYHDNSKKFETASYGSRTNGYHSQSAPISWLAYADSSWYTMTNGQSIYPFNFNNIAHNINGAYKNSGTDAGLFVAPIAGVYQFNWNIFCQSPSNQTTAATLEMYVRKNGSTLSYLHNKKGYGNMGDDQEVINLSVPLQLAANDKIGVIFSAYSATWRIYGGHSTFSGHLIG